MKHIKKRFLFVAISAGLAMSGSSCKKYLNVNSDPNRVTDDNVTAELVFTQSENAVGVRQASANWGFLDQWMGYFAPNGGFVPQQNVVNYNIDPTFGNTFFLNMYDVLFDLNQSKVKGLASGDKALAGASMAMSAKLFQEVVDMFGNLPYTQAFQSAQYPNPAYDKAQDIYKSLQVQLDSAIIYLGGTAPSAFGAADIINQGDQTLWIKFANTMKLRLLIRQSEVAGFDPSAEMTKIIAKGGVLTAGQTIDVNPGYSNDVNKQNPFYGAYGWSPTGTTVNTSTNANNYIVTKMSGDPRLGRFFYPVGFTGSTFAGGIFGESQANIPMAKALSYFGPALVGTVNTTFKGDGTGAKQNQWIYPSYESMFLWAEAVARGWVPGNSDAKGAYNAALLEAFTWLGVSTPATAVTAYQTANAATADFANAGGTPQSQAKFIAYQKYLSLVGIDPYEVYTDQNRLHFLPDNGYISVSSTKLSSTLPLRIPYPNSEVTSNAPSVQAQGTINIFTSKLFWQP